MKNKNGFTLIELLITVFITCLNLIGSPNNLDGMFLSILVLNSILSLSLFFVLVIISFNINSFLLF